MARDHDVLPAGHKYGWDKEDEDWEWLKDTEDDASVFDEFAGEYEIQTFTLDQVADLLTTQSQRAWPSCRGHSLANCIEWLHMLKTGNPDLQFSRHYCWVETQRYYTRPSVGRGATMSHGYRLAKEKGVCEESYWPYPYPRYTRDTPDSARKNAEKWKIAHHYPCSYDRGVVALGSQSGVVDWGIRWKSSMRRAGAVVERFSGGGGGGHAVCAVALSERVDKNGENYWIVPNSHGSRWGKRGFTEISPTCAKQILDHSYTTAHILTDLSTPQPQAIDWFM